MIADSPGDRLNLPDRPEIERAAPDERMQRLQEIAAQILISGGVPGSDEGSALPRQGGGFVIADRRIGRQRERGDLRRRPQPQVDPKGVAVLGPLLQQLDDPLPEPKGRLVGLLARAPRQRRRIVDEDQVEVGRIIELVAAQLPQGDRREAAGGLAWRALGTGSGERPLDRAVGEIRERRRHRFERQQPAQVGDAERQRLRAALAPQRRHRLRTLAFPPRRGEGRIERAGGERGGDVRETLQLRPQERGMRPCPRDRLVNCLAGKCLIHGTAAVPLRSGGATFATRRTNAR